MKHETSKERLMELANLAESKNQQANILNESVLAIAGGIILGILGLRVITKILKSVFAGVDLARMTDPVKLKQAIGEIGKEVIEKEQKNPLIIAMWMAEVGKMVDNGIVKNGIDLARAMGKVSGKEEFNKVAQLYQQG